MLLGYIDEYFFCREKIAADLILYVHPSTAAAVQEASSFARFRGGPSITEHMKSVWRSQPPLKQSEPDAYTATWDLAVWAESASRALHRHTDDAAQPEEIVFKILREQSQTLDRIAFARFVVRAGAWL